MSETLAVRDERLVPLDHHVASAADDWFDNPRDAKVYGRLVEAIETRRAYLRSRRDVGGTKLGTDVPPPHMTAKGTADQPPGAYDLEDARGNAAARGTKADKTRTRVLDAAAKVFSHKGYTGTRLADIAAEADMHAGSLYYHFRTREELVDEVLRVGQERVDRFVRDRVTALPPDTTNLTRLRELIAAHLAMVLEFGDYTSAMIRIIGQVPEDVHQRRLHDQRQYGQYWRNLFEDAQANGELRSDVDLSAMRMIILGALNSSPDWYEPGEGPPVAVLGSELGTLFLTGLAIERNPTTNASEAASAGARPQTGMSRPGGTRRGATRARILDATATVLREHGYAGTPLSAIATVAGLRPGSVYYYFQSREDLLATLLGEAWEQANRVVRGAVETLPESATPIERLSAAMAAHLASALDHNSYTSGLLRTVEQLPEEVRHPSLEAQLSFTRYWHQLVTEAKEAGEIRPDIHVPSVVAALIGTSNWAIEWYESNGRLDSTTLVTQFTAMVLHGLGAARVRQDN